MSSRSTPNVPEPPTRRSRAKRTFGQRLLLGVGVILSTLAVAVAAVAGWATWKYLSIDRADVELDRATGGPRNYLIVGSDSRSGGDPDNPDAEVEERQPLADTIMILRLDPSQTEAELLSLPRDLWLTRADGEEGRINAAYGSGPQNLIDTIRMNLDIPIHHYLEVDFAAFRSVVDAVGGVPMWFDEPVRDLNSGLAIAESGCIHLDPTQALAFARSRHLQYLDAETGRYRYDGTADLGRISRQQLFIRRVIGRATAEASGNPMVTERVISAAVDNVTLDQTLGLSDLTELARTFRSFDSDRMLSFTVPVTPRTTTGGAQVLDLDREAAEPILSRFRDPVPQDEGAGQPVVTVPAEEVTVAVYNSSGIDGWAATVAADLEADGFDVTGTGNGSALGRPSEPATIIRHAPGLEMQAAAVAGVLDVDDVVADPELDGPEVLVFLGAGGQASTSTGAGSTDTEAGAATSTTVAASTTTTIPSSEAVGVVPGDPPAGTSCG